MKQCKKCKGKLSRRDIERYEELCAKCRVNHCQLKQTAFPCPAPPGVDEKFGWFTAALRPMLVAATVSADEEKPQDTQEKRD